MKVRKNVGVPRAVQPEAPLAGLGVEHPAAQPAGAMNGGGLSRSAVAGSADGGSGTTAAGAAGVSPEEPAASPSTDADLEQKIGFFSDERKRILYKYLAENELTLADLEVLPEADITKQELPFKLKTTLLHASRVLYRPRT